MSIELFRIPGVKPPAPPVEKPAPAQPVEKDIGNVFDPQTEMHWRAAVAVLSALMARTNIREFHLVHDGIRTKVGLVREPPIKKAVDIPQPTTPPASVPAEKTEKVTP